MSLLPIRLYGDPVLRQVAVPVGEVTARVRRLAGHMIETMYAAPGRGLAAPQVGECVRMFVMDCDWKDGADRAPVVVIDPEITEASEEVSSYTEGCLSLPGLETEITRSARVRMRWRDLEGVSHDRWFDGFAAVCVQHEYDHLDGVLTVDRIDAAWLAELQPALRALAETKARV